MTSLVAVAFGLATFVLHFATAGGYGYQRDELYFMSCAQHLAWGYVDQPPLIAVITKIAVFLFGDSLRGIRLLPAVAATFTVLLTGRLARRLGGGLFAQALAMLGIALAPFYLAVGNLLTMNAFEPLLWIGAAYLFIWASENDRPAVWGALGVVCGLGLLNKYSMFFFLGACIVAIGLTETRRVMARPGFWAAIGIALALVAPSLVWQAQHGWPQIAVLRNAGADKNVTVAPFTFYVQQILMMNPLAAPIWIAGLYALFFTRAGAPLRWYGFAYVILSATYLTLGAKVYYLAPIYPVLFAAGAPWLEARIVRFRPLAAAYPVLLLLAGFAIAPEAFPLLPLPAFLAYQHVLDLRDIKMERHPEGLVPQQFAEEMGWDTLVKTVATVYAGLPPAQQREAAILTRDYGQAAAIDFLGAKYGLPQAISGHNNYYLYGTRGASGNVVITVGITKAKLQSEFRDVRLATTYRDAYLLPDFNNLPVYVCTQPIESFAAWWPVTKHYI
jgi:4-amino-4-deoxy-L-arabinose transferase-like glycosyltransferase